MIKARLLLAAGALAAAVVLSGCIVFKLQPVAIQSKTLGSVHVTIVGCAAWTAASPPAGSCPVQGNSQNDATGGPAQILVAFRIPTGSKAPTSFSSTSTGPTNPGPQLNFTKSDSYASELQRLNPGPAGIKWVGYISQLFTYSQSGEQNFTASLDFTLPAGTGGHPFLGPFQWRPVIGVRRPQPGDDGLPVNCSPLGPNQDATVPGTNSTGSWICIDDPERTAVDSYFLLRTRDAAILPGAKAKVTAGKTARITLPFQIAGPTPPGSFTFSATAAVPGASPKASPKTFTPPGDSTNGVTVSFKVPKGTAKGTYLVTLTARLADGETRTGTAKLKVSKPKKHG